MAAIARLPKADSLRRPVDGEDLADDVLARHRAPLARVARLDAVVAHEEVHAGGDVVRLRLAEDVALRVPPVLLHVRLDQLVAVDVDGPRLLLDRLAGQA